MWHCEPTIRVVALYVPPTRYAARSALGTVSSDITSQRPARPQTARADAPGEVLPYIRDERTVGRLATFGAGTIIKGRNATTRRRCRDRHRRRGRRGHALRGRPMVDGRLRAHVAPRLTPVRRRHDMASLDAERQPRALIQSCLAASAARRRTSSWSTRTARPSSTTTRPSTMTVSTSRPWPTWTRLPRTSVAGVR